MKSPKDLNFLKKPFGTLIPDSRITKRLITSMLKGARMVIAVGDATTERLASFEIIPDIAVIDGVERRSRRAYPSDYSAKELRCVNIAGSISQEAMQALREALEVSPPVRVIVDGEEDLLALPLFSMSPKGSIVLYGQPLEGLVIVHITAAKQKQAKGLMEKFLSKNPKV